MQRKLSVKVWTLLTLCLTLSATPIARADEAEIQAARQLGKEAIEAYQAGDYATAIDKLHRAYRVIPATTFGLWLGRALAKQGNLVEASEWYVAVMRTELPDNATEPLKQAKVDAQKEHQALQARIPSVVVTVEHGTPSDTAVTVDQKPLKPALWGVRFPVNPGTHRIAGQRGEETLAYDVTLAEGQSGKVPLVFTAAAAAGVAGVAGAAPAAVPPPAEEPPPVATEEPPAQEEPAQAQEPPAEEPAPEAKKGLPLFAVVPKIALQLAGGGTQKRDCSGSSCAVVDSQTFDYSHNFGLGFGADFLFTFAKMVRVGVGPTVLLPGSIDYDNSPKDFGLGTSMTVNGILEAMFQVAGNTWLGPRVQGGLFMMFPGNDFAAYADAKTDECNLGGGSGCDDINGSKKGWNIGAGLGFLQGFGGPMRLRADFLFQHDALTLANVTIAGGDVSESMKSNRFFLMVGVEIP